MAATDIRTALIKRMSAPQAAEFIGASAPTNTFAGQAATNPFAQAHYLASRIGDRNDRLRYQLAREQSNDQYANMVSGINQAGISEKLIEKLAGIVNPARLIQLAQANASGQPIPQGLLDIIEGKAEETRNIKNTAETANVINTTAEAAKKALEAGANTPNGSLDLSSFALGLKIPGGGVPVDRRRALQMKEAGRPEIVTTSFDPYTTARHVETTYSDELDTTQAVIPADVDRDALQIVAPAKDSFASPDEMYDFVRALSQHGATLHKVTPLLDDAGNPVPGKVVVDLEMIQDNGELLKGSFELDTSFGTATMNELRAKQGLR